MLPLLKGLALVPLIATGIWSAAFPVRAHYHEARAMALIRRGRPSDADARACAAHDFALARHREQAAAHGGAFQFPPLWVALLVILGLVLRLLMGLADFGCTSAGT
ncbi:hypothetical protein [Salipiger sp.]|uniref:hypothetical protein n=1 Tax=Salipiger sp. TaxID=2078585 RepID=UPI003A9731FD